MLLRRFLAVGSLCACSSDYSDVTRDTYAKRLHQTDSDQYSDIDPTCDLDTGLRTDPAFSGTDLDTGSASHTGLDMDSVFSDEYPDTDLDSHTGPDKSSAFSDTDLDTDSLGSASSCFDYLWVQHGGEMIFRNQSQGESVGLKEGDLMMLAYDRRKHNCRVRHSHQHVCTGVRAFVR